MKNILLSTLISLFLLFSVQPSFAHFHYEAEVTTTLQLDENNQLSAIKISWIYDPEVSELMLKDNPDLKSLSNGLIKDLAKLDYFTHLKLNDKPLQTEAVKKYTLEKLGKKDQTRLKLKLTLPLKTPIKLQGKNAFAIDHTDPSGSAILYYENANSIQFDKKLEPDCLTMIEEKKDFEHGESPQIVTIYCDMP